MSSRKTHGLKPNIGTHQTEQSFGGPTAMTNAQKSEQEKDSQKTNETSKATFGTAPFVQQTAMVQAKQQNEQSKAGGGEIELQQKEAANEAPTSVGSENTQVATAGTTGNDPNSFTFIYAGKTRTMIISGNHVSIQYFSPQEAQNFSKTPDQSKLIYGNEQMSVFKLLHVTKKPHPGDEFDVTLIHSDGSKPTMMHVSYHPPEAESKGSSQQEAEGATSTLEDQATDEKALATTQVAPNADSIVPEKTQTTEDSDKSKEDISTSEPTGPYWKHEWHVDRFGNEAVFIWEVGGKRWRSTADRGYAYLRNMASKVPGDDGYDPRFEKFKHRPQASEGENTDLNWWFKKTPGWDDKNKQDDGSADFQDLAEFKDVAHNKKGTGFYYMGYVFDPLIYEKLEAQKREKQNAKYLGAAANYAGFVGAENGIILHTTPSPDDPGYQEKRSGKNKADFIIGKNAPVTVLAEGNENFEGWVFVRSQSGEEGWIERRFLVKERTIEKKSAFASYSVKSGDTLEEVIEEYYATYPFATGNDKRTVALAIYLFNKNRPGAGIYRDQQKYNSYVNSWEGFGKGIADPWMKETRANYQSVELYAGGEILLPPKWYIDDMRKRGEVEKRPDFVNMVIEGGRVVQGFIDGVGEGFVDALVGAVEDIYNLIVDIFTGQIFSQLADMFKTLWDLGFEGIWEAIKEFGVSTWEEMNAAWNNPNPYERGKYFGEIIGMILFEVVIAILTAGIGTLVKNSARFGKLMKMLPGWMNKLKKIPVPDDASKHLDDLKKLGNGNKPDVDLPDKKKLDGDTKDISDIKKIDSPESAKKFEKEIDATKKKELEGQAKSELDADPNWKDKKDTDEYAEKLAALATAKIITEGADLIGLPIAGLKAELAFLKALPEVKDFEFEGAADVYKVYMIGSKFLVDGKYTESGEGKYRILGKSKNGNILQQGDSKFGWQHIVEGHVEGKPGKSMFPKGMSNSKIRELILEASDIGSELEQGVRIKINATFKPSKYGISKMELWINKANGNIIETAYPTAGTSVWTYPR